MSSVSPHTISCKKDTLFPRKIVIAAVTITTVVFCFMIVVAVVGYQFVSTNQKRLYELQTAYHEIANNDETRTTTLLLAVTRGDDDKKGDYDQLNARITAGIDVLRSLLQEERERAILRTVDMSLAQLHDFESRVFSFLEDGLQADAHSAIVGAEYADKLSAYYTNMRALSNVISLQIETETRIAQRYSLIAAVVVLSLSPVITALWILIFILYIRKRKQYELAQKETEKAQMQFRNLVERNNDGVIVLQDGLVKFCNARIFTLFDYQPQDIISKPFIDFVAPEFRELVGKRYKDRLTGKDVESRYEFELLAKNGEHLPVLVSASLTVYNDRPAIMAIVRDMRQEKRLEQMRYDFVSIASHQLRTPLTGVKWFSELLLGGKNDNLTRAQKDFVKNIHQSNQRMIHLIDDLLDVSHIQEGSKFPIIPKPENMIQLAHEAIRRQSLLARNKKITLSGVFKKSQKAMMHIDREKIMQVFQNLLSNAIKYSPKGSKVELGYKQNKNEMVFFVRDHGVGIPSTEQAQIFEKFFRATNVKTQEEGTGLGLYIAKAIVRAHGGKLWFESKENKGTTFYFSLPIIS